MYVCLKDAFMKYLYLKNRVDRMSLLESINDLRHRLLHFVCVLNGVLLLRQKKKKREKKIVNIIYLS